VTEGPSGKKKVVIIGTGGLGREALWLLEAHNEAGMLPPYDVLGFLTSAWEEYGATVCGLTVLGPEDLVAQQEEQEGVSAVCAVDDPRDRRKVTLELLDQGVSFATVIHPSVARSQYVEIGTGCIICAGAVLTAQVKIGNYVIINVNASVGHDAVVEDFATLGPGVRITGHAAIGYGAELGANSVVVPHGKVGRGAVVGAGAVVVDALDDNCVADGAPARIAKTLPKESWL